MHYTTTSASADSGSGIFSTVLYIALFSASLWKLFTKAVKPSWASLIPVYNLVVLVQIVGRPVWWIVLLFIPFVNIIATILLSNDLSKSFGRGSGTTLLLIFLPFIALPMLGFGSDKYVGPVAAKA